MEIHISQSPLGFLFYFHCTFIHFLDFDLTLLLFIKVNIYLSFQAVENCTLEQIELWVDIQLDLEVILGKSH